MGGILALLLGGLLVGLVVSNTSSSDEDTSGDDTQPGDPGDDIMRDGDTITGTPLADFIQGSEDPEVILPGRGDDVVRAWRGADLIDEAEAGSGDDSFYGGDGADTILSRSGSDEANGGLNEDFLGGLDFEEFGVPDTLNGGWGEDTLLGDDGDLLTGGPGTDSYEIYVTEATSQAVVEITDYESGEPILVVVDDPDLMTGTDDVIDLRDTDTGAMLAINGTDILFLRGTLQADVPAGALSVVDNTEAEPTTI